MRKKLGALLSDRWLVGGILLVLEVVLMLWMVFFLSGKSDWFYRVCIAISIMMVVWLVRKDDNPAYKTAWIIIILVFPLCGGLLYLIWGNTPFNSGRRKNRFAPAQPDFSAVCAPPATDRLVASMPRYARGSDYIRNITSMPVWGDTATAYYPLGEHQFAAMCEAIAGAKKFVFLEYFIIEEGKMWDTMLALLIDRVKNGVEVRVLYDDAGCFKTLPGGYDDYLRSLGIRVVRFNKFIPTLNTYMNHRNHRKICVVDGNIGFMGGINLADEYINHKVRFGHWKDTGIRLNGPGVSGMTMMFLQMWEYAHHKPEPDVARYMATEMRSGDGYVQPFYDSPMDGNNVGEAAYMQIINRARRYVYITTPYLALDNEMVTALTVAAQSGIDVRIITPGIPDKKMVFMVTRSYYQQLLRAGVHIYEYRPGFIHSKMIVSDDEVAIVGTMNMDFRSFYLHFECGTVLYGGATIREIRTDIEETMGLSREIDLAWVRRTPWIQSIAASLLRLFAPLL